MNRDGRIDLGTKAGLATIVLGLVVLGGGCSLTGIPPASVGRFAGTPYDFGCALAGKPTVAGASTLSYLPYRPATQPSVPTPYQAEPYFFGYHGTWWRSWPECCAGCSPFPLNDAQSDSWLAPSAETVPAPPPVPRDAGPSPEGSQE